MQAFHTWIYDILNYREYAHNSTDTCIIYFLPIIIKLIQICYATLSKMESKYMKTSHSRAWECKPFIHVFLIFRLTEYMDMILHIHTSYYKSWEPNILSKTQTPLQQVRPQHESVGEWRRRNERIGR